MENYPYSSFPDSGDSSPQSREIDPENATWDDQPPLSAGYKVKFMCSYGGKIHPRPHDNQLTYVGGDTKILAVDRNVRFSAFLSKLSNLCDSDVCFKYQLPGEDLDALISVTNDEDLEHMMMEYDRLYRASAKPARLRLFLFPLNPAPPSYPPGEEKSERQWFVDALNSVQIQPLEDSSAPSAANPDFLFGLEKGQSPVVEAEKALDAPPITTSTMSVPDVFPKETRDGSEVIEDPLVSPAEFQRMQMTSRETNPRAYQGEYFSQKVSEKLPPAQPTMPVTIPAASYYQERHVAPGGYHLASSTAPEQPVYLIQTPSGLYQAPAPNPAMGQMSGQVSGQGYYGMQRVVPEVYREQQMYGAVPPPSSVHTIGMARPSPAAAGASVAEQGYSTVAYDGAGRQVYYAAPGGVAPQYQAVDTRQGGAWNQDGGKVVVVKSSEAF